MAFPTRESVLGALDDALARASFAARTRNAYRRWTLSLLAAEGEEQTVHDRATRFLADLADRGGAAKGTVRQARSALAFLLATLSECPTPLVLPAITRLGAVVPSPPPTPDDVARIAEHCTGPTRIAVDLLWGCGLSAGTAVRLRVGHIDLVQERIRPLQPRRCVPIPPAIKARLAGHVDGLSQRLTTLAGTYVLDEQPLLPTLGRVADDETTAWRSMSEDSLQRQIARAFARAQLPTKHACRALQDGFVLHALAQGATRSQVKQWMGWATAGPFARINRNIVTAADQPVR